MTNKTYEGITQEDQSAQEELIRRLVNREISPEQYFEELDTLIDNFKKDLFLIIKENT